jgi:sortase A
MRHKISFLCILLGLILLLGAVGLAGYFLLENRAAGSAAANMAEQLVFETASVTQTVELPPSRQEIPDYVLDPNMEMPSAVVDGHDCIGVVEIPKLDKRLPVISRWSYDDLRIEPCRYDGSAYDGSLIIAAHNYTAHFGSLSTLQAGDRVTFTDMDGKVLVYAIMSVEVIPPTASDYVRYSGFDLVLYTCTYSGENRIAVFCERVEL